MKKQAVYYFRLLLTVSCFFFAFLLLYIVLFRQSEAEIRARELESAQKTLDSAMLALDNELMNARHVMQSIRNEDSVLELRRAVARGDNQAFGKMLGAQKALSSISQKTPLISDHLLFFSSNITTCITSEYILNDIKRFIDMGLFSMGRLDAGALASYLSAHKNDWFIADGFDRPLSVRLIEREGCYLPFTFPMTADYVHQNDVTVYGMLLTDMEELLKRIIPNNEPSIGYRILINGDELAHDERLREGTFEGATELHAISTVTRLQFTIYIPKSYITRKLGYMTTLYYITLCIFSVLCCSYAVFLLVSVVRPLKVLSNSVDSLYEDNVSLRTELDNWTPIIKNELIGRILSGVEVANDELDRIGAGIIREGWEFIVVVLMGTGGTKPISIKSRERYLNAINEAALVTFGRILLYSDSHGYYIMIVGRPADEQRTDIHTKLVDMLGDLQRKDVLLTAGIGRGVDSLLKVCVSFEQALAAGSVAKRGDVGNSVCYGDIAQHHKQYAFTYGQVEKMYNLLLTGNEASTLHILTQVLEQNMYKTHTISDEIMAQLFYDLKGILLRVGVRIEIGDALALLPPDHANLSNQSFIDLWESVFRSVIARVCEHNSRNSLIARVVAFINDNFTDSNISLKMVSSNFSITDRYLSTIFKDKMNINFSDYLEDLRLSYAEILLRENNRTIEDIAEKVGYISSSTFHKAFKRKHGITPANYHRIKK